ncbi:Acetyltransferase ataH [Lachnellula suecica]|uniref:Acetyltransferase ataH n=1 Tax=Lachnellula suecica TaxID=602035 RepID=A0A8T9CB23_9HELO|nr:Acetyltransferase ataH [Lachnellula suecica]
MISNPLHLLAAEIGVSTLVVAFTNPNSLLRPASLPFTAACMWFTVLNSPGFMVRSAWAALLGGYAATFFFQYLDVGLLSRWSFETRGPTYGISKSSRTALNERDPKGEHPKLQQGSSMQRIRFALSTLLNFRFIGTPEQVKNVPRFPNSDPNYVPSRRQFLQNSAITTFVSYLVLDILTSSADPGTAAKYFSNSNIPLLSRLSVISAAELGMRFGATIGMGVSMICVQQGICSVAAFFCVAYGISKPEGWPTLYGLVSEAYSLRRFWGIFWHQSNSHKLKSLSRVLLQEVLRLPPRSQVTRHLRLVVIFSCSGLMHVLVDIASGIPLHEFGAMSFFMVQIVGIMVEDAAINIYQRLATSNERHASLKWRILGYIWVLVFLTWSVPSYLFPILIRSGQEESIIPFSIISNLKSGTS